MVTSAINHSINYPETKDININDSTGDEIDIFSIKMFGQQVDIIIGHADYSYLSDMVTFFPVYLWTNKENAIQIGVYEFPSNTVPMSNGELDIDSIVNTPLTYSFVTNKFILSNIDSDSDSDSDKDNSKSNLDADPNVIVIESASDSSDEDDTTNIRQDVFTKFKIIMPDSLTTESKEDALKIRNDYNMKKSDSWIEKFLKNTHYDTIDNDGMGDCFFFTIRDAFQSIGQHTTVDILRNKISAQVTVETFDTYTDQYNMFNACIDETTRESIILKTKKESLKKQMENALGDGERNRIMKESTEIDEQYKELKNQNEVSKELLKDFKFMKHVQNVRDFRNVVKTPVFWADVWAIGLLEVLLNIKFIILSGDSYRDQNDFANVLRCGSVVDPIIESRGEFTPDFYIIVEYTSNHYKLITYKHKRIFKFYELPFDLKRIITEKCMERSGGLFNLIPEFRQYKKNNQTKKDTITTVEQLTEDDVSELCTDDIVFMIYGNSAAKPFPGKGSGEKISQEDVPRFFQLAKIENWRRMLDNGWISPFEIDGKEWASAEHYIQASKFKSSPDFFNQFSVDSDSDLSKDVEMAKFAGSKRGVYKKLQIRPKNISPDSDFFPEGELNAIRRATHAKFFNNQNESVRKMLLETKNAKLMFYRKGKEPEILKTIMTVRKKLQLEGL
jgi:hypothetical protein